mgnify:CR=1 FL=1
MRGAISRRVAIGARLARASCSRSRSGWPRCPKAARRRPGAGQERARAADRRLARAPRPHSLPRSDRPALPQPRARAGPDRQGGDVLPDGRLRLDGRGEEGPRRSASSSSLYLFLTRHYEKIDIVFIRHHTQAQEVDEENFFRARETGGTVVSSALVLMDEIIKERYSPSDWNIYAAQASDGDNWHHD